MNEHWLTENWNQLMSATDELIEQARHNAQGLSNAQIERLLAEVMEQRAAAERSLRSFGEQRHALLGTLDQLQSELAVAGQPLRGEIS